jgi:hypothetical protein
METARVARQSVIEIFPKIFWFPIDTFQLLKSGVVQGLHPKETTNIRTGTRHVDCFWFGEV